MIETSAYLLGQQFRCDVTILRKRLKQMAGVSLSDKAKSLVRTTGVAIVGAHKNAILRILQIITFEGMIVCFKIRAVSGGINHAEISLNTHWTRQSLKKTGKIINRAASLQSLGHDNSLLIHFL